MKKKSAANQRIPQEMPLSEYAIEVLINNRAPMHVNDLTEAMIKMGWKPVSAKPTHVVYTNLFGLMQRKGDDCGIKLLGKGVFATERQARGLTTVEVKQVAARIADVDDNRSTMRVESDIPLESRICGNCKSLEFTSSQELYLQNGVCGQSEKSKRTFCTIDAVSCPYWAPRPAYKIAKDKRKQKVLQLSVLALNCSVKKARKPLK